VPDPDIAFSVARRSWLAPLLRIPHWDAEPQVLHQLDGKVSLLKLPLAGSMQASASRPGHSHYADRGDLASQAERSAFKIGELTLST